MDSCTSIVTVITICGGGDERDVGEGTACSSACGGMISQGACSSIVTGSVPTGAAGGTDGSSLADAYIAGRTSSTDVGIAGRSLSANLGIMGRAQSTNLGIAGRAWSADAGITGRSLRTNTGRSVHLRGLAGRDDIFEHKPCDGALDPHDLRVTLACHQLLREPPRAPVWSQREHECR